MKKCKEGRIVYEQAKTKIKCIYITLRKNYKPQKQAMKRNNEKQKSKHR
jgi:hypothetical protein